MEQTQYSEFKTDSVKGLDVDLLKVIEEIESNHSGVSWDMVFEFFQYNGQQYMDVVVGYYSGGDSLISGYFYDNDVRIIFRNTDSCRFNLFNSTIYEVTPMDVGNSPPHEPTQYSYVIHNEDSIELFRSVFKNISGRVVLDSGNVKVLDYRMPWPFVIPPPPPLPDEK